MKSYEQLKSEYDEALFALLMEKVMVEEGELLLAENERLKSNPEFEITPEMDRRMLSAVDKAFQEKKRTSKAITKRRVWGKCVAAVLALVCMTGVVFGVSPTVRASAIDLIIMFSEKATSLFISDYEQRTSIDSIYSIDYIPDGFYQHSELIEGRFEMYEFKNDSGARISIQITHSKGSLISSVDTENAEKVESISVNGNEGLMIEKNDRVHISIVDVSQNDFIDVVCNGIDSDTAMEVAQSIKIVK